MMPFRTNKLKGNKKGETMVLLLHLQENMPCYRVCLPQETSGVLFMVYLVGHGMISTLHSYDYSAINALK